VIELHPILASNADVTQAVVPFTILHEREEEFVFRGVGLLERSPPGLDFEVAFRFWHFVSGLLKTAAAICELAVLVAEFRLLEDMTEARGSLISWSDCHVQVPCKVHCVTSCSAITSSIYTTLHAEVTIRT
jgi:hypothetical protein